MKRAAGDFILVVRKSHAWYWRPRVTPSSPTNRLAIHWLGGYIAWPHPTRRP